MSKFYDFQSCEKRIALLGTVQLILLLKHSYIIAKHMVEVYLLDILSSDGCKTFKSMEVKKFKIELRNLERQVRVCEKSIATFIDTQKYQCTQLNMF